MSRSSILLTLLLVAACGGSVLAQNSRSSRPEPILVAEIGGGGRAKSVQHTRIPKGDPRIARDSNYGLEQQTFDLLNGERAMKGLSPLVWDERVAEIARLHSRSMASQQFFGHKAPDGSTVDVRADRLGMGNWSAIAENIAFLQGYDAPAINAVSKWLSSPGHRRNILGNGWNRSAVGVAVAPNGGIYFTQVFMKAD